MWLIVMYDLPTYTEQDKRNMNEFRSNLIRDGYSMFMYSVYVRHCATRENAQTHEHRMWSIMPPEGKVSILRLTDRQFGSIKIYEKRERIATPSVGQQLEMF